MGSILEDGVGRTIDYVRISVTDRCDFRCVYCMAPSMTFLPRAQVLRNEEILRLCSLLVANGVKKIRLTGGEPLVRQGVVDLCAQISALPGLRELVMTTNGASLTEYAIPLKRAGLKRLNVSLDTLDPARFREITRTGSLRRVLQGIDSARNAGFERIKLNVVVMRGSNDDQILPLIDYAISNGLDISFIEEMPIGQVGRTRTTSFMSSQDIRQVIERSYALVDSVETSGGPSRYCRPRQHPATRIGFISPQTQHFCATCNRVRITAEGRLLLCLGHEHSLDLRSLVRNQKISDDDIVSALRASLQYKPRSHHFSLKDEVSVIRFMNMTGG